MSQGQRNKEVVGRWFKEYWGNPWNPAVVDDLAAADVVVHYPLHGPWTGPEAIKRKMIEFRQAFPDLNFWASAT
ncbi:ester cyclase [Methylorubrum extorquens]|uniref:ester cyclase n=1 Tax=Methylorubrum extorquens TaxID=408 RepID=UPI002AA2A680|nr:ester cyclase [Methylorubrum extorquens]